MLFRSELTNTVYPQFKPHLDAAYKIITDTLVPDVPKHLMDQAANRLSNSLHIFITRSLYDAVGRGLLSVPTETDRNWLSLYAAEI